MSRKLTRKGCAEIQSYLFGQPCIFLEKLNNTVRQLWMIHAQTFDLMKWNQNPS